MARRKITIIGTHVASEEFGVTSVKSDGRHHHRREPCPECPWRKDVPTGVFPAEAFRFSARTACDMAQSTFGCHMSGTEAAQTCAGFLLRNAEHNLSVRLAKMRGEVDPESLHSSAPLYRSYREMAIANGVDPRDSALADCRGNDEPHPEDVRRGRVGRRGTADQG
jgi:hypothetical protein